MSKMYPSIYLSHQLFFNIALYFLYKSYIFLFFGLFQVLDTITNSKNRYNYIHVYYIII